MPTRLRIARERAGLTQVEVAKKANIPAGCYQRYEAGSRIPKADTAVVLAKILRTSVEDLYKKEDE